MSHNPNFKRTSSRSFYKRKSEWRKIIDSTWGPGLPLAQKRNVFDTYTNFIRAHNTTFVYTRLNWDSVAAYWRSRITDSTSRGGFSAILSSLVHELHDGHGWAWDAVMDSTPLNPGTPILVDNMADGDQGGAVSHFGACLTALPDSSLLVYMVTPNHPLGLEPGDIVLGYEGVPWKELIRELMAAEIPTEFDWGTSPSAIEYYQLFCAGENWHLFDTIDVVKYKTGQTVHLSTDTLICLQPTTPLVMGAQIPVPGVPMPGWAMSDGAATSGAVTYGIIQGTNIGYIYVYHHEYDFVGAQFNAAVTALSKTHGLIIDIRFDIGGWSGLNAGIARLTSYTGPTLESLVRSSPTDLSALVPGATLDYSIPADGLNYKYPVAVLVGPTTHSYGDVTSHQLTYLDNVRFFGKSTNGAYNGFLAYNLQPNVPGFVLYCPDFLIVDEHSPNTQLWGREFPVDEHVWLTPTGAAKGEDDVVKRAIEWMSKLTYAHDVVVNPRYTPPGVDSICITTTLANPLNHDALVRAIVTESSGIVRDSILLFNDGLHGDGSPGDSVWGCRIGTPLDEGLFNVSLRTDDITQATFVRLPNASLFTTAGPLALDSIYYLNQPAHSYIAVRPYVINNGKSATVSGATVSLVCNDPIVTSVTPEAWGLGNMPPGAIVYPSGGFKVNYSQLTYPACLKLYIKLGASGYDIWTDSVSICFTGVADKEPLPTGYTLEQNYPNPFNPSTSIGYQLPTQSHVVLQVLDVLGREVARLVNERQEPGYKQADWNASGFASGIYFYRLEAIGVENPSKTFTQVRKMTLLK